MAAGSGIMLLTIGIGRLIYGPDFEIEKHEELEILTKYPFWWVKVVIVLFAVIVALIYEEIDFPRSFSDRDPQPHSKAVGCDCLCVGHLCDGTCQWRALAVAIRPCDRTRLRL